MLLYRFILSRFITFFTLLLFSLTGLYMIIEAFEKVDNLLSSGMPPAVIVVYFLLSAADIVHELSPLMILLAGLLTLAAMGRSRELLALRAIGISPRRILAPILMAALLLSILFSMVRLLVIPSINEQKDEIVALWSRPDKIKGVIREGRIFFRGSKVILSGDIDAPDASVLSNFECFFHEKDFQMQRILASATAIFNKGEWHLKDGIDYKKKHGADFFSSKTVTLSITPEDLIAVETPAVKARPSRLADAIMRLKKAGLPYYEQLTQLLSQVFYSLLGFSMLFSCLNFIFYRVTGGPASGLVIGTAIGFAVWSLWNFSITMAATGNIHPLLAVLLPHTLLITVGIIMNRYLKGF